MTPDVSPKKEGIRIDSVLRTSLTVFLFLMSAKFLNFFKKILVGRLFGVSWVADAFFAASYLPYYLGVLFEGIIFLGFLPLFSQVLEERGEGEANRFAVEVVLLICLLTGSLVALGWGLAPWVAQNIVPGFNPEKQHFTASLFRVVSLVLIFISLRAFFQALNSYFGQSALAASSGFVDSMVMVGVALASWKMWGIYGAAWACVIGALVTLILQMFPLFRKRPLLPHRFSFGAEFRNLLFFLIPMTLIWSFQQIPIVILNRFGSGMWEGTISALTIAHALTIAPMGLVNHTVLFAVFPSLAKQANESSGNSLREIFFQTLKGGLFILIPAGLLLTALARPLAVFFFSGGGIAEEGTRRIANSLACFGWATFALYADLFMTQSLIAVRRPIPAILLCASRAILTYLWGYFLSSVWDYQGLALGFSLALVLNFFLFFPLFFRLSPFQNQWGELFRYSGKLLLASSPIFFLSWVLNRGSVARWISLPKAALLGGVIVSAVLSLLFYIFLLSRLRVAELRSVLRELKGTWARRSWWLAEQSE